MPETPDDNGSSIPQVVGYILDDKFVDQDAYLALEKGEKVNSFTGNAAEELIKSTKQVLTDPNSLSFDVSGTSQMLTPPYNLEQLLLLREIHPIHGAALDQKTADTAGAGWEWVAKDPPKKTRNEVEPVVVDEPGEVVESSEGGGDDTSRKAEEEFPDESELEAANAFLEEPNDTGEIWEEIITALVSDKWTLANAYMEVVRRPKANGLGQVTQVFHVPAQTIRISTTGDRYLQTRSGKNVWFKKYREQRHLDSQTGTWSDGPLPEDREATELLHFRRKTSRSSWYGIPEYVSATAAIAMGVSLNEYNRSFFNRYAVPSWAVVIEGAELSPALRTTLEQYFRNEVRANPHRVLTLGIPYVASRPGGDNRIKVTFVRLSDQVKDMSFKTLAGQSHLEVCIAHRMPPFRISWPVQGQSNGQTPQQMNGMYKTGVIEPEQIVWASHLTRFFKLEFGVQNFRFKFRELDITDKLQDMMFASQGVKGSVMRINEARHVLGLAPDEDGNVILVPGGYGTLSAEGIQVLAPASGPTTGGGQGTADNPFGQNGNNGQPDAPPQPGGPPQAGPGGRGKSQGRADFRTTALRPIQRRGNGSKGKLEEVHRQLEQIIGELD